VCRRVIDVNGTVARRYRYSRQSRRSVVAWDCARARVHRRLGSSSFAKPTLTRQFSSARSNAACTREFFRAARIAFVPSLRSHCVKQLMHYRHRRNVKTRAIRKCTETAGNRAMDLIHVAIVYRVRRVVPRILRNICSCTA